MMLKIGVIVHGPGIIDTGYAKKIIDILNNYGTVTSRLGGTMGRTAVLDAKLEQVINIEDKLLPSQSIELLSKTNDVLFLLNYGKSTITGHTFAYKVLNNLNKEVNLIQIERPGEEDGTIVQWNKNTDKVLLRNISHDLNLPIITRTDVEKLVKKLTGFNKNDNIVKRKVAGVSIAENIMLNGVIIGKVTDESLTIISKNNKIVDMIGGKIKKHGLEKLGNVDLSTAIIKTGLLRNSLNITPRKLTHKKKNKLYAVFLDHSAEDIYKYKNSDILISIGDDTTLLSSDILYRFNIPIIGITDGDLDKVVKKGFKLDNSIIIQVDEGYDDIVGKLVYEKIFNNKNTITINNINDFKEKVLAVIDNCGVNYKFVDKQLL